MITTQQLEELLEFNIDYTNKAIKEFKKDFNKNPGQALDWSMSVFEKVAENKVNNFLLSIIKKRKITIEDIYNYLLKEVVNGARYSKHSTSITANLWAECLLQANSRLLETISGKF